MTAYKEKTTTNVKSYEFKEETMMKKLFACLLCVCMLAMMIPLTAVGVSAGQYEYAVFPMKHMSISQGVNGSFSHQGTKAIDITGKDGGIDSAYAPFTGVIKKIYQGYTVWLESVNPVMYANGTVDYMTVMLVHDNDTSDLYVGKVIQQGERFFEEGTAGYATGNHIHLECGRGKFQGSGWYENSQGKWMINNSILPYDALFVADDTVIYSGYGYNWKSVTHTHSWSSWSVNQAATCGAAGEQKRTCACGEVETQTIPVTGNHTYSNACDASCNVCGTVRIAAAHVYDNGCDASCNVCGVQREAAHDFVKTTTEATCTEYGKNRYTCQNCGYSYEEILGDVVSEWSEEYPEDVDAACVESKTEYRYRVWEETTVPLTDGEWILDSTYTRWSAYGAWGSWQDAVITANENTQVETRTAYRYYYYKCPNCGAHMHVYTGCYTWAGGCGQSVVGYGDYFQVDSTIPYSSAGLKDFHGTGRNYTYIDGQLVFQHRDGSLTQYRARTKTQETVYKYYKYTDWADWSEACNAPDAMAEERTVYRYVEADLAAHVYDDEYDADCNACGAVREVAEKPADPIIPDLPDDAPAFVVEGTSARAGEEFTVAIRTQYNSGMGSLSLSFSQAS